MFSFLVLNVTLFTKMIKVVIFGWKFDIIIIDMNDWNGE